MATGYHVEIQGKRPYGEIDGKAYCIWCYKLSADPPRLFVAKIGLGFSLQLDIKDPATYPEVTDVQGTFLDRSSSPDRQYVYFDIPQNALPKTEMLICFIAPCAESLHTVVTLQTKSPGDSEWTSLSFDERHSDGGTIMHHMRGPLDEAQQPPTLLDQRVLPYASENFGVYQPLLGWRSRLSKERISAATANRFTRATSLINEVAALSPQEPIQNLQTPTAVDRTGSAIGEQLAVHVSGLSGGARVSSHEWSSSLAGPRGSTLSSITQNVLSGLTKESANVQSAARQKITKEAATATLLYHLGQTAPAVLSEMFQPKIANWERTIASALWFSENHPAKVAFLSPIGILHRFREYFFELGSFLGPPVGHVWLSPGGTVELVEVNTRRTLVERTVEQSTETVQKTELSQTDQDELSGAIKTENANDTKLGITAAASGGVTGVWQASGSASFNLGISRKEAQEQTHKRMREQSSKLSSEVRQNYKTTFRTVTETTDTSSRRYVLQNTTPRLVSYELSRKMRKVAVQVQDLGQQLCWQLYVDNPGDPLGLGEFVHEAMVLTDPISKPPDEPPPPPPIPKTFSQSVAFKDVSEDQDSNADVYYLPNNEDGRPDHGKNKPVGGTASIIQFEFTFEAPAPPPNYVLTTIESITFKGEAAATTDGVADPNPNPSTNHFTFRLTKAHFHKQPSIPFDVTLIYMPTQAAKDKVNKASADSKAAYNDELERQKEQKFYTALRARLKLVGKVRPRPQDDLREEERSIVYRAIITHLFGSETGWTNDDYHVASELIRYLFDVDAMLYFVAPDWWRPRQEPLVSKNSKGEIQPTIIADSPLSKFGRIPRIGSFRPDYLITEETAPAPQGASLGWLIQLDGDVHRNAFLNSPWVKAVLPIRPGRERDAIAWLRRPEIADTDGLEELYPFDANQDPPEYKGLTMEGVLLEIADRIAKEQRDSLIPVPVDPKIDPNSVNPEVALPAETVFSHGFDPLEGGIKFAKDPKDAFKVFSQWIEVLPTDQVVATEYKLTGL